MKIIALFNSKGGVGKTTSSLFIATEMHRRGYDVLVVDADPQRSALQWSEAASLPFEVVTATSGQIKNLRTSITSNGLVLIDCPPGHEKVLEAVASVADAFIVPTRAGVVDVDRAVSTVAYLHSQGKYPVLPLLTMARAGTKALVEAQNFLFDELAEDTDVVVDTRMQTRLLELYSESGHKTISDTGEYASICDVLEEKVIKNDQ